MESSSLLDTMLERNDLLSILQDWSFWDGERPPEAIPRDLALPTSLVPDIVLIIQGVRRSGKSTLLTQMPDVYKIPYEYCYYCNFEDPRLLGQLNYQLLESIVKLAEQTYPGKKLYFFFDEIQNVRDWEKWLHAKLERPRNHYFTVSGSNSFLLSGEFATALTGRHLTFELYPFSFLEYRKVFPQGEFEDYLCQGGFPRVLRFSEPKRLLQEYFNDIILRDVQKRVHARSPQSIQQVAKIAFDACGSELSYRKVAAICGFTIDTVKLYLEACEQAYLLFTCEYFAFSIKKRLARNKKFYPIDAGMRAAVNTSATQDLGKGLEQMVFLRLKQLYGKVYYWREQGEVDFVTFENKKITPYQVSWERAQPRHQKALEGFYTAFPQAENPVFIHKENFVTTLFA